MTARRNRHGSVNKQVTAQERWKRATVRRRQIIDATINAIPELSYQRTSSTLRFIEIAKRAPLSSTRLISWVYAVHAAGVCSAGGAEGSRVQR